MRRRDFIKLVGGSAVAWPLALRAQQSGQLRRIGVLIPLARDNSEGRAFLQGLQTPCSNEFDVKVVEQTGDIVSGDGNRLTTPNGADFKCGDHIGDCDPQSARISLSRKGLPQGWARDLMRRDAQITSTGTKICFEANSYCQESRLVEVQIGA